jgi:hypothetical protein
MHWTAFVWRHIYTAVSDLGIRLSSLISVTLRLHYHQRQPVGSVSGEHVCRTRKPSAAFRISTNHFTDRIIMAHLLLLLLFLLIFVLCPLACFPSEVIYNYTSYSQSVRPLGRVISHVPRPLPIQDNTNTGKKRRHASMPQVGFESTILVFKRAKMFFL